jgi:hypothetical protein
MTKNCPESCYRKTFREPSHRVASDDGREEFYELSARDANGKALSMENFEGYVTVLVNAARVCGEIFLTSAPSHTGVVLFTVTAFSSL